VRLRTRLTLALVALSALGLAFAGLATYRMLERHLIDQLDERLAAELRPVITRFGPGGRRPLANVERPLLAVGTYVELRAADGTVTALSIGGDDAPQLPDRITSRYSTVDAQDGSGRYRVIAQPLPNGNTWILAMPLDEVEDTLRRLLATEVVVASLVLAALGGLGWWAVRAGLRPLEDMASTAGAIAAGDLSRRVDHADERTEVGRLGTALNAMLGQIEEAFAQRAASEEKLRRFVADASHELRTPLTSIRGYSELFRRGADQRPEDLEKVMRRIEDEAARMGILVDDLLLLARLDQGRPLEREPVDLTNLATDAVEDARVVAADHVVSFEGDGPVVVLGDAHRLRQVLGNLIANACTHTPAGTLVTVRVASTGDEAILEVADRGPGLAAGEAEHVFERFWRADPSRTRASGGAGLGLSIVAAIAAAHGGRAEVDSEPGAGATFRVRLPLDGQAPPHPTG
jgi:two-component system OmpR family sensor kinase